VTRKALASIALVAAVGLLAPAVAAACSCIPLSPERVQDADAAVIAELERVRADEGAIRGTYVYRVRRALVGSRLERGDRLRISSHLDSAACGLPQEPRRYGLVLDRNGGRWTSSLCTQTSPEALRALVRGERSRGRYC
jgi:hypothetical protein